jgi:hypothetical protein
MLGGKVEKEGVVESDPLELYMVYAAMVHARFLS